MAIERTLSIIKPDGVEKNVIGAIISHFEKAGLRPVAMRMLHMSREEAEGFYAVHKSRPFFDSLVKFMTSSPVLVLALRGNGAITIARNLMGATFGSKANPGTIRGDFGVSNSFNLIHGSDSPEAAERELKLFFGAGEVLNWGRAGDSWIYDMAGGKPE